MIIALLFGGIGIVLTIWAIVLGLYQCISGRPTYTNHSRVEDELMKQSASLKRQTEIMERERMERLTKKGQ